MPVTITQQPVVNSTTYIDLLGVLLGLTRLTGETSTAFAQRVRRAGMVDRSASYQGLMNEIGLQFGFDLQEAIALSGPPDLTVSVDLAGLHMASASAAVTLHAALASVDSDNFWQWRLLSDLVADINGRHAWSARLLTADGPAFTLVQQSNSVLIVGETITGQSVRLAHAGILPGTETFNWPVPAYTTDAATSTLTFASPIPNGTQITYRFAVSPFSLISSPVFLMSMLDPNFVTLATTPDGYLVYQAREMVNELLARDGSYWTA